MCSAHPKDSIGTPYVSVFMVNKAARGHKRAYVYKPRVHKEARVRKARVHKGARDQKAMVLKATKIHKAGVHKAAKAHKAAKVRKASREPQQMDLTEAAWETFEKWAKDRFLEAIVAPPMLQPMFGRLEAHALKLGIIIQLCFDPTSLDIDEETIDRLVDSL